jgi:aminodeoxyfutalosine synthase
MTLPQLLGLIRGAGKVPAERDSFYRVLREFAPDETGAIDESTEPLAGAVG